MKSPRSFPLPEAPSPEVADLVERVCLGELTAADTERLEALVTSDCRVRQFYVRYLHMHAALPALLGPSPAEGMASDAAQLLPDRASSLWFHRRSVRATIWTLAVAVNFLLAGLLALMVSPALREQVGWDAPARLATLDPADRAIHADSLADSPIVRLARATDCRWIGPADSMPEVGDELITRSLHLQSGIAELAYGEGVRLAIHGPTKISIASGKHVSLTFGNLLVRAEQSGRGFTVSTSTAKIIDLGTEFGVSLEENGRHEVQVFEGSVEVQGAGRGPTQPALQLITGQKTIFGADASSANIERTKSPADATRFAWAVSSLPTVSFPATARRLKGSPLRLVSGGKPVTGNGAFQSPDISFSPSAVTDGRLRDFGFGNEWSFWVAADNVERAELTVDLEADYEIAEIRLQPTHNGDWQNRGTKDFRLLVSADGNEFIEVAKGTLPCVFNQAEVSTERYPLTQPVRGRYVKFEALSWYGLAAGLNEIQVFVQRD